MLHRPKNRKALLRRERDKRLRERRAAGQMVARVVIDHHVVSWLVTLRYLPEREAYSVAEIEQAVTELLRVSSRD
jgi:hypothetical protein